MNTACLLPLMPFRLTAGADFVLFAVIPQHFMFPEFRKRGSHPIAQ